MVLLERALGPGMVSSPLTLLTSQPTSQTANGSMEIDDRPGSL